MTDLEWAFAVRQEHENIIGMLSGPGQTSRLPLQLDNTEMQKRHYVASNQARMDAAVEAISLYLSEHEVDHAPLPAPSKLPL